MAASYPSAIKTFATRSNGQTIDASHVNDLQDEVAALETALLNGLAHHLKFTDATYDIGASGATRPRDLYLSRDLIVGDQVAVGGGVSADVQARLLGSFTGGTNVVGLAVESSLTVPANGFGSLAYIAGTLVEAGSGTHALLSCLRINIPTITAGAASVTNGAGLYIQGAPAPSGGANYAIWVDADDTRLDGQLIMPALTIGPENSGNFIQMTEMSSDAAAPAANTVKMYVRDNGAGKTQVVARFATGAVQVMATEP